MMSKLSQQTVKQLLTQKASSKKVFVWDDELRGFGACRNPAGAVSFVLNYRVRGKERRYTIGQHPEFTAAMAISGKMVAFYKQIKDDDQSQLLGHSE